MQDFNLYNVSLFDLELFMNVARYGSFTKAGEKLFITQSVASKRISQMENELDLTLFTRSKRKVTLTPAGRVLAERFQNISDDILDAIQAAHVAQTGASGYLCVGYLEWGNVAFIKWLKKFIDDNPQFSVAVYREQFFKLRTDITQGRMDIIFTMSYDCGHFSGREYNIFKIQKVPLVAYMSKDNPLSSHSELTIEELRAEPMLMVDQKSSSGYGEYVKGLFGKRGIRPLVSQYAHDGGEHVGNILINKGVLLASGYFLENSLTDQIARIPISGEEIYVTAIWRKSNENPALMKFLLSIVEEANL